MAGKVERSVTLPQEMATALDCYAKRNHISGSQAIRGFIEKGLEKDSYTGEQGLIKGYIKAELAADIKPYMERLIKIQAKSMRTSAAALMTTVKAISDNYIDPAEPEEILANALKLSTKITQEDILSDEDYLAEARRWLGTGIGRSNDY